MKTSLYLLPLFLTICQNVHAQPQLDREVIASAGGYGENAATNLSISWTLGEVATATLIQDTTFTEGFQHPGVHRPLPATELETFARAYSNIEINFDDSWRYVKVYEEEDYGYGTRDCNIMYVGNYHSSKSIVVTYSLHYSPTESCTFKYTIRPRDSIRVGCFSLKREVEIRDSWFYNETNDNGKKYGKLRCD